MKELITIEQAQKLMLALLIVLPLAGAFIGALNRKFLLGLLVGALAGIVNFVLWSVYNSITNHFGLDSVKGLLINLALFCVVGILAGLVWTLAAGTKRQKAFRPSVSKNAFADAGAGSEGDGK